MDPTSSSLKYCASMINCSRDPNGASCDLSPVEVRQLLTGTQHVMVHIIICSY